jgi:hypothetical protein
VLGQQSIRLGNTSWLGFVGAVCEVAALAVLWFALRRKRAVRRNDSDITEIVIAAPPVR